MSTETSTVGAYKSPKKKDYQKKDYLILIIKSQGTSKK